MRRRGLRWNAAFILGVVGAVLVMVGATLPQLILPGYETGPLVTQDSIIALDIDSGAMVVIFALYAILFCLVGRYRWIIFCAIMMILFLTAALSYQLIGVTGLSIANLIDLSNGILPPNVDPKALLGVVPALENAGADTGLMIVGAGIVCLELAPWLKRFGGGGEPAPVRSEPHLEEQDAQPEPLVPEDLLVDGIYFFAEGLARPMSFNLMNAAGHLMAMRASLTAAGYLGDTYFVRCRDLDVGNLRDVPAHMMSDIVDEESGERIDTDDFLNDLAQVAYETIEGADPEAATEPEKPHGEEPQPVENLHEETDEPAPRTLGVVETAPAPEPAEPRAASSSAPEIIIDMPTDDQNKPRQDG